MTFETTFPHRSGQEGFIRGLMRVVAFRALPHRYGPVPELLLEWRRLVAPETKFALIAAHPEQKALRTSMRLVVIGRAHV